MFSKLPELFDRNFAIGYFLPAITFIFASIDIAHKFGFLIGLYQINQNQVNTLIDTTILGLVSWLAGVFLLAINKDLLRLMEGYGRLNPLRLFYVLEKSHYRRSRDQIDKLNDEYIRCIEDRREFAQSQNQKRNKLIRDFSERFPDQERWLLPTPFGNTIRAFEVYSRLMYGIDSIPGWERLLAVIPEDYRKFIDASKSQVDFWVNTWILSIIFLIEYFCAAFYVREMKLFWVVIVALFLIFLSFSRAKIAAVEWGNFIKASFDVYLPVLYDKMGFPKSVSSDEEKEIWRKFSQAIIYVNPEYFPSSKEREKKS